MKRKHVSCKDAELSTCYPQGVDYEDLDIMDPPDLFSGTDELSDYDDDAYETPRMPQERRSSMTPTSGPPVVKDASVRLPTRPEMFSAIEMAALRGDVVTSGAEGHIADGVHKRTSLHYDELAIDIRPSRDDRTSQAAVYRRAGYNVIEKPTHLHVSFDPEGRRV